MRIMIIGATSAIAKECAKLWAEKGATDFILVGRSAEKLEGATADLRVRFPLIEVKSFAFDMTSTVAIDQFEETVSKLGQIDIALIAHGELTKQDQAQASSSVLEKSLGVNVTSPALFAEMTARLMQRFDSGNIGVIGSVAGDRGRRTNYSYGAAKAFLATYVQGMQHRFAGTGIHITLVKPGPTASPMTADLVVAGRKLVSPQQVARHIVAAITKNRPVVYTPPLWGIIMLVVRLIPRQVFNKLNF
jgi:decaprenylphospho-beta-D-erythro-pentofuranosid-2-ulose 2-reductase